MKPVLMLYCLFLALLSHAQTVEKNITADIKNVVVYLQGAQITRSTDINVNKGTTVLLITGLSAKINTQSIQVSENSTDVMIASVVHSFDFLNQLQASKEITALERQRDQINDSISLNKKLTDVYQAEKDMIIANRNIGGTSNGVNINDLKTAADFFRTRLSDIELALLQKTNLDKSLKQRLIKTQQQLLELNAQKDRKTSQIAITVSAEKNAQASFDIKYIIDDAQWKPLYDVRVDEINKPLQLDYKAQVRQNTDEDWKNVQLTLSTGDPSISAGKPTLQKYELSFGNYYRPSNNYKTNTSGVYSGIVKGKIISSEDGSTLPGVTVTIKGQSGSGVITDFDGNYSIQAPYNATLVYSFVGMKTQEIRASAANINVVLDPEAVQVGDVVVTAMGISRASDDDDNDYKPEPKKQAYKPNIPIAIQKQQTTTEFRIDIPYSIPTDNKFYDVNMVEYQIPAQFEYSCIPKLSTDAYLMAKIVDWQSYNLLSGNMNIFFKGTFIGTSYADLQAFSDTLGLSVGRDNDIVIKREPVKNFTKRQLLGSYRTDYKAWEISIRNNKSYPIHLEVEDQYPVSTNNEIKIEHIEHSNAVLEDDTGKLTWKLDLQPAENKTLMLRYSVKYPKDQMVIID